MKNPAGYGQIIKLSGKRRRPYAVRVFEGNIKDADGIYHQKVRYLEYFEKRKDAMDYLARYNAGIVLAKKPSVASLPTFSDAYDGFMDFYTSRKKEASDSALGAYRSAFKNAAALHHKKMINIRADDMQSVIRQHSHMSKSTIANLIKLFHGVYKYAMRQEIVEKDYSQFVFAEYTERDKPAHTPFTDDEIGELWRSDARIPLILVYTGMRKSELAGIRTENIHFDERYMIGGIKTAAGRNRIIPIHDRIFDMISEMSGKREYLCQTVQKEWNASMAKCGMRHTAHDARHTAASLMERYGIPLYHRKLILGHAVTDLTEGVYTHVPPAVLVEDINKIAI